MVSFAQKEDKLSKYTEDLSKAKAGVFFDYCGLTVEQFSELRSQLFEQGAKVTVVKNTVFKRALEEAGRQELESFFKGTKAVLFAFEDEVAPFKSLKAFLTKSKIGQIQGGFVDKQVLSEAEVKQFADLPSLPELQGKLLGAINTPLVGVVRAIGSPAQSLVSCLDQLAQKKEAQGA